MIERRLSVSRPGLRPEFVNERWYCVGRRRPVGRSLFAFEIRQDPERGFALRNVLFLSRDERAALEEHFSQPITAPYGGEIDGVYATWMETCEPGHERHFEHGVHQLPHPFTLLPRTVREQAIGKRVIPNEIRRSYRIRSWIDWADEINAFVEDFRERYIVAPNIMLASSVTYRRIDLAAHRDRDRIRDSEGEDPADGEYAPLGWFVGDEYELELAIDDDLPERYVDLIYDTDPNGGGEPIEEDEDPSAEEAKSWTA